MAKLESGQRSGDVRTVSEILRWRAGGISLRGCSDNVRLTEKVSRGGGPVYDMGVYRINTARYLFRAEPTHVFASSARGDRKRFRNTEEMSSIVLKFSDERLATFTLSFGAANVGRYTLAGTKGILEADPEYEYAEGNNLAVKRGRENE